MTGTDDMPPGNGGDDGRERVLSGIAVAWFLGVAAYYYQSLGYIDLLQAILGWGQP